MRVIASTGGRFVRFGPYVPAPGPDGRALFQAQLVEGTVVVEVGTRIVEHRAAVDLISHPVAWKGGVAVYGADRQLYLGRGQLKRTAVRVGPLGPTADDVLAVRDGHQVGTLTSGWRFAKGEQVTGLPIAVASAVWARLQGPDGWRVVRNGDTIRRGTGPTAAFLGRCGDGVLLVHPDTVEHLPSGRRWTSPIRLRGALWAGVLVTFSVDPSPLLCIDGVPVLRDTPFALNAASVEPGRVLARVAPGLEHIIEWRV